MFRHRQNNIDYQRCLMTTTTATTATNGAGSSTGNSSSPASLQAQLDRCTRQLGDWTSCSSGKTTEGKQIIQALEEKISSIKAQIQATDNKKTGVNTEQPKGDDSSPVLSLSTVKFGTIGTQLNILA